MTRDVQDEKTDIALLRVLARGAITGIAVASFVLVIFWRVDAIRIFQSPVPPRGNSFMTAQEIVFFTALLTVMISLPLAAVGGAGMAWIYAKLPQNGETLKKAIWLGMMVSFCACLIFIIVAYCGHPLYTISFGDITDAFLLISMCALGGAWHGWQTARWLQRRRQRPAGEA